MIVVDLFREIVENVSDDLGIKVNYQFGDWRYMAKTLQAMSKTNKASLNKYPIIGLFSPFVEDRSIKEYNSTNLSFIIATATQKDYTNEQRLQYSFKNILHPVYYSFIESIKKNRYIQLDADNIVKHKYVDNYRYGSSGVYGEGNNKFDDMIDGIDITDMQIKVKQKKCTK